MRRPPLEVEIFISNFDDQYTKTPIDIDTVVEGLVVEKPKYQKKQTKSCTFLLKRKRSVSLDEIRTVPRRLKMKTSGKKAKESSDNLIQ